MDLSELDSIIELESADCVVTDPTSGDTLFTLVMAGPEHAKTLAYRSGEGARTAARGKRAGGFLKALEARAEELITDPEEARDREVDELCSRTLDWKGVTDNGANVPFDAKVVATLYRSKRWLREQVSGFLSDTKNWRVRSSKH